MRHLFQIVFISIVMVGTAFSAPDVQINGTRKQTVTLPANGSDSTGFKRLMFGSNKGIPLSKTITILTLQLSSHAKETIENEIQALNEPLVKDDKNEIKESYPLTVQLGMGNVPVLDQGFHGSCATFAVTAAVDAVIQKGDYVSQLCQLQLGRYLEQNALSYTPGGWDGTQGRYVLGLITQFGIVSKSQEAANGCGGLTSYPLNTEEIPSSTLSLDQFHRISEDAIGLIEWATVLDMDDAFRDDRNGAAVLNKVKAALATGDRLSFATVLFNMDAGSVGAVGLNHVKNDTWVFTDEMKRDFDKYTDFGGHEMVITGYDDQATAKDSKGRVHRGLLTLRNSWGTRMGDQGNFYMSYEYFKTFVIEAHRIGKVTTG